MRNLSPRSKTHCVYIQSLHKTNIQWKIMWYLMGRFSLLSKSEKITSSSSPRLEHIRLFIWTKRWWLLAGTGVSFFRWRCSIWMHHRETQQAVWVIHKNFKTERGKKIINYFLNPNFKIFNLVLICNTFRGFFWGGGGAVRVVGVVSWFGRGFESLLGFNLRRKMHGSDFPSVALHQS